MWGRVRKDRQQEGEDGAVKRVTSLMAFRVARGGGAERASQISGTGGDQRCSLQHLPSGTGYHLLVPLQLLGRGEGRRYNTSPSAQLLRNTRC